MYIRFFILLFKLILKKRVSTTNLLKNDELPVRPKTFIRRVSRCTQNHSIVPFERRETRDAEHLRKFIPRRVIIICALSGVEET